MYIHKIPSIKIYSEIYNYYILYILCGLFYDYLHNHTQVYIIYACVMNIIYIWILQTLIASIYIMIE